MKILIYLGVLLSSAFAFAGPEDHIQAQVCYRLSAAQYATKGANVPPEVCVEEVSLDPAKGTVYIYSYFNPKLFTDLKVDSLVRQTEDTYRFQVSQVVFEDWNSICDDGETVTLKIKADSDFTGAVQKDQLKVTVEQEYTNDSCHTPSHTTEYIYSQFN